MYSFEKLIQTILAASFFHQLSVYWWIPRESYVDNKFQLHFYCHLVEFLNNIDWNFIKELKVVHLEKCT